MAMSAKVRQKAMLMIDLAIVEILLCNFYLKMIWYDVLVILLCELDGFGFVRLYVSYDEKINYNYHLDAKKYDTFLHFVGAIASFSLRG